MGTELERAWEYHKQADILLSERINYGLVAQSMLFVAYATLFSKEILSSVQNATLQIFCIMGIFFSWVQYKVTSSLAGRLDVLSTEYLKTDDVYKKYTEAKPGRMSGIQSRIVPMVLALVWLVLLSFVFFNGHVWPYQS